MRRIWKQELRRKGKDDLLEVLKSTNMDSGAIAYIRQHRALVWVMQSGARAA